MVDIPALRRWLAQPRTALVAAVADGVLAHVAALRSEGAEFYGYALLAGESCDIGNIIAATNSTADIKVPPDNDQYRYYRYSVDEWEHYHYGGFTEANRLIVELTERFRSLHVKEEGNYTLDEFEVAHADAMLDTLVRGLRTAKHAGAFGGAEPFLAVWISDSSHSIMVESVQRLNSEAVADEFVAEFG